MGACRASLVLACILLSLLVLTGCDAEPVEEHVGTTASTAGSPAADLLSLEQLRSSTPQEIAAAPYAPRPRYSGNLVSAVGRWLAWVHLPAKPEQPGNAVELFEAKGVAFTSRGLLDGPPPVIGQLAFSDPLNPPESGVLTVPTGVLWNVLANPSNPDDSYSTHIYFHDPELATGRALTTGQALRSPPVSNGERLFWAEATADRPARLLTYELEGGGTPLTLLEGKYTWSWIDASPGWLLWFESQDEGPGRTFHLLDLKQGSEVATWGPENEDSEIEVPIDIAGDYYFYRKRAAGSGEGKGFFLRHLPSAREAKLPSPPSFAKDFRVPDGAARSPLETGLNGGLLYWAEQYRRLPGDAGYLGWSIGVADISQMQEALAQDRPLDPGWLAPAMEAAHGDASTELLDVHLSERGLFWAEGTSFEEWSASGGDSDSGRLTTEQVLRGLLLYYGKDTSQGQ